MLDVPLSPIKSYTPPTNFTVIYHLKYQIMTIYQCKRQAIVLDNQQQITIKGGTGDATDFVILEDIDIT